MSAKETVISNNAPAPIGPYSQGVKAGNMLFISGAIGINPANGEIAPGGIEAETRQALNNVKAVLEAAGASMDDVVKTTVFLMDINEFAQMNKVYAEFFQNKPPARSAVQVAALPKSGAVVEIEAIAVVS